MQVTSINTNRHTGNRIPNIKLFNDQSSDKENVDVWQYFI